MKHKAADERGLQLRRSIAASACGTEKQTFKVSEYQSRYIVSSKTEREIFSYSGVGILHELTPEEMEEAFRHHLTERNKEKTA